MTQLGSLFGTYKALVLFDTETSGLDFSKDQIIELAALRIEQTATGGLRIAGQMDQFLRLPDGQQLPEKIIELTGITDRILEAEGVPPRKAATAFAKLINVGAGPVLLVAHNAQFDLLFVRSLLKGVKLIPRLGFLDTLTIYKDRRPYPHKLADAIMAYDLEKQVKNSHRAIDDVMAMLEVLRAMGEERDDLGLYVNLFGYNPKYGVNGSRITGIRYEAQEFHKILTRPEQTLPAKVGTASTMKGGGAHGRETGPAYA